MFKIKMKIAALVGAVGILLSVLTTPIMAISIGLGASGGATWLQATGKETLKQSSVVVPYEISHGLFIPSVYLQVTIGEGKFGDKNGFVIGIEHIPGEHEIDSKSVTKSDLRVGNATTTGTNYAQAELSDHSTIYIESPGFTGLGLFVKAGWTGVTVKTNETLITGAAYGDKTINAKTVGGGLKGTHESGIALKVVYEYTDYDNISLSSTGSDAASTVTADADSQAFKISIGYNF